MQNGEGENVKSNDWHFHHHHHICGYCVRKWERCGIVWINILIMNFIKSAFWCKVKQTQVETRYNTHTHLEIKLLKEFVFILCNKKKYLWTIFTQYIEWSSIIMITFRFFFYTYIINRVWLIAKLEKKTCFE